MFNIDEILVGLKKRGIPRCRLYLLAGVHQTTFNRLVNGTTAKGFDDTRESLEKAYFELTGEKLSWVDDHSAGRGTRALPGAAGRDALHPSPPHG